MFSYRRRVLVRSAVLFLISGLITRAHQNSRDQQAAAVDQIFHATAAGQVPGAAVAILYHGQPVLIRAYGLADIEKSAPIVPTTIFRIGSVTKSFTAVAILQLVQSGKLRLDDPVTRFLPDFPHGNDLLIRHLLSHTGGIPDFVSYEQVKNMPLEFAPATRINYSNTGYDMLGTIIEKVSGLTYEEYLRKNIFKPAGMIHSGYDRTVDLPGRARGYLLDAKGVYNPISAHDVAEAFAAGGLYSTVEDLFRFEQALASGEVLDKNLLEQATTPVRLAGGRHTAYGLGFMTGSYRGLREFGHGGDIDGFNAYVMTFPEQEFTVIVLSNTGMRPPGPIPDGGAAAYHIADIYLAKVLEKPALPKIVHVDPLILDTYVGHYQVEAPGPIIDAMGGLLTISRDHDQLSVETKMGKMPLTPKSETIFETGPGELTFVRDSSGKVSQIIITLAGLREFPAHRSD